jgi:hypothetical protein
MLTIEKKERIAFLATFILTAGLVLLDRLTTLEINRYYIFFIILFIAIGSLLLMVCQYLFGELSNKFIAFLMAIVFAACFGMAVLSWRSDWKTQTIIYRSLTNPKETIEYRMRGSNPGYVFDKQVVRKRRLFPFFDDITAVDTSKVDLSKWAKVDERVNEMEFPGEYVDLPAD